ncbi:hypothetical protein D3C78_1390030 [compost metagenome]
MRIGLAIRPRMKSPSMKRPLPSTKKARSVSPSRPTPRSAPTSLTLATRSRRLCSSRGLASWLGKVPSGSKYMGMISPG